MGFRNRVFYNYRNRVFGRHSNNLHTGGDVVTGTEQGQGEGKVGNFPE